MTTRARGHGMTATAHMGIVLVEQAQAQKEVTVNEALARIDAVLNTGALDKDLSAPPGSPAAGDVYIIATGATGDWAGHDGDIAYYDQLWRFISPQEGMGLWVCDEDVPYTYRGALWAKSYEIMQNISLLGVNATADSTNRLAVRSTAVLVDNIGAGVQVKLNKSAAGDAASFLFQTGYSGRAEIGCVGDDDFRFKVSADGASFATALLLEKNTGRVTVKDSFLSLGTPQTVTIASGAITATRSYVAVDTESAASTDDLASISGGQEGDLLILKAAHDARTVVLKDGSGNLQLSGDFSLDSVHDRILLQCGGSQWLEVSRSGNS